MIVEPTPTNPRSPLRRALRMGGLVVPIVLLAAVMTAGFLGPKTDPPPEPVAVASPVAGAPPAPSAGSGASPSPGAGASAADLPPIPVQFGDLGSTTPGALVASRREGGSRAAVAVGGYLRVAPADACADKPGGPLGPWCVRSGALGDTTWAPSADGAPVRPPHVHLVVPVAVRLPAAVERAARAGGENRVLVVGRFGGGAACDDAGSRCDDGFVVERFAWVDGVQVGLTPLVADRLDTGTRRPNPFELVTDAADMPLYAVLVWPDAIAGIDPGAATLAAAGPRSEPVWYLRVLDGARGPGMERRIRWVLLAENDLRVLGSGRPDGMSAGAGSAGTGTAGSDTAGSAAGSTDRDPGAGPG